MTSLGQASPDETGEIGGMGSGVKAVKVWAGRGLYSVSFRFASFRVEGGSRGGSRFQARPWSRYG